MDSKTRMNDFAELLNDLILSPSRNKKIDLLKNFFCKSNLKDKGWAFCILTNRMDRKFVSVKELKELIIENSDEDLFRFSYDYVGDLAETISLLWESNNEKNTKINLHEFMEIFSNFDNKKGEFRLTRIFVKGLRSANMILYSNFISKHKDALK